jgi:Tfp pilus assembly protein PilN
MSVALNICGTDIKILWGNGRRVKKWAAAELPPGLVHYGAILDPKAVGLAVRNLFKCSGMPREQVIMSVSGLPFTYRFLKLPRIKSGLVTEAIMRAAKKEFSTPLEELYLSWQQLPDEGDEFSFFVLGVSVNLVDAMVETLKIAGIEPYLMGVRPLALARTAERSDAIIVNVEACCFDIVFVSGGIPRVIHTITPRSEAATVEDNILRLADELTKTAAFFQSNNPEAHIDKSTPLLLTGDWAANPAVVGLIKTEVEYPIEPLVAHLTAPPDFPMDTYAALFGLALKKIPQKTASKTRGANYLDININILAGKYRKPKAKPVALKSILTWLLIGIAIVLLYPLYQARAHAVATNTGLETELSNITHEKNIATLVNEDNAAQETTILSLKTQTDAINSAHIIALGDRGAYGSDLETVTSLLPAAALYSAVKLTHSQIAISGEADNLFTVTDYAAALDALGKYYEVRINILEEGVSAFSAAVVIQFEVIIEKYPPSSPK